MTYPTPIRHDRPRRAGGFTLVEMMVTGAIVSLILLAVLSTFVFCLKAFRAVANYVEIHAEGRMAVDLFARDMRAAGSITSYAASDVTVLVPTNFTAAGSWNGTKTVRWYRSGSGLYRDETVGGLTTSTRLANNITNVTFNLFTKLGSNTVNTSVAKGIQVELELRKYVLHTIQSEDYLSARLDMRNKP